MLRDLNSDSANAMDKLREEQRALQETLNEVSEKSNSLEKELMQCRLKHLHDIGGSV